jgi:predicted regulator of Ras-like GTPase activity (Roadblock/LC7/MglB family)
MAKSEVAKVQFASDGPRIRLPLPPILRGLAPSQLSGPTDNVHENAVVELPFAIVQPQLSLGKVSISPTQFQAALPAEYRDSLIIHDLETPIALPLQDVLQNLPNESLKIRDDQEAVQAISTFETPFSQKAAEDEARLKRGDKLVTPGAKDATTPTPTKPAIEANKPMTKRPVVAKTPEPAIPRPISITPPVVAEPATGSAERDPLQLAFDTDETMSAKNVVAHASRLPGVRACAIVFSDGLSLAGNIPAEFKIDPLCAIAPVLVKKCQEQMVSANLGTFAGLTLSCTKSAVTFFAHGDICLAALHWAGQEIEIATRTQLSSVTEGLARTYTQPSKLSA